VVGSRTGKQNKESGGKIQPIDRRRLPDPFPQAAVQDEKPATAANTSLPIQFCGVTTHTVPIKVFKVIKVFKMVADFIKVFNMRNSACATRKIPIQGVGSAASSQEPWAALGKGVPRGNAG
jgi:hypothetical protein